MICAAIASTYQVSRQVFVAEASSDRPFASCRAGLDALYGIIAEGRKVADEYAANAAPGSEVSLEQFRHRVRATWRNRDAVSRDCKGDSDAMRALRAIERLRYSEEHGVRFRATEIIPVRRAAERRLQRVGVPSQ
jgi:hypothetical protein